MNPKAGYVAAVLDEASVNELKKRAVHPNVYCHHVTLAFRPTEEVWRKYENYIGEKVRVKVVGIRKDGLGQVGLVDGIPSENDFPHITISCANRVKPVYSNEMFRLSSGSWEPLDLSLTAVVEFIPFTKNSP